MKIFIFGFSLALSISILSCSSASSTGATTLLATAFPEDLAFSSPTAPRPAIVMARSMEGIFSPDPSDSAAEKKALLEAIIKGSDCSVALNILNSTNANCYGPTLTYSGHPDGLDGAPLPGGDLGIWQATETGTESCSAAQLNQRIKGVASQVDAGMFAVAGMLCVAKSAGSSLPALAGSSVDLTADMAGKLIINSSSATVSSATLARVADVSGFPVYVSSIQATQGTTTYNFRMKHVLTATDESTFRGKLTISVAADDGLKPGNCSSSSETGNTQAVSIVYEKSAASMMATELRSAQYCGAMADPYKASHDYTVDLTKKLTGGLQTGWANNANYINTQFNTSSGAGTYQYAWQAGMTDSHARVFNLKIDSLGSNAKAFFGFGNNMSNSTLGNILGMICNWAGPGNVHSPTAEVQSQDLALIGGVWTATASHITYDPVNACESSTGTFSYNWSIGGTPGSATDNATTKDLTALSEVTVAIPTYPTAPADVD